MTKKSLLVTLILVAVACVVSGILVRQSQPERKFERFDHPVRDLRRNVSQNDFRFRAVRGLTLSVPGTSSQSPLVKSNGVFVIEGTSDSPRTDAESAFQDAAAEYAGRYNTELLRILNSQSK